MVFEDHLTKPLPGVAKETKRPARVWKRLAAFVFDIMLFNLVVVAPMDKVLPVLSPADIFAHGVGSGLFAMISLMMIFFLTYVTLLQYLIGQTFGMMLLRLEVENSNSLWRAVIRNIFILPFFPFALLWIIDPLYLFFAGDRLTERLSGTRTLEVI